MGPGSYGNETKGGLFFAGLFLDEFLILFGKFIDGVGNGATATELEDHLVTVDGGDGGDEGFAIGVLPGAFPDEWALWLFFIGIGKVADFFHGALYGLIEVLVHGVSTEEELSIGAEDDGVRDSPGGHGTADTFGDEELGFVLFEDRFDIFLGAALALVGDDGETLFAVTFVHLDQMGHCCDAGTSPGAPLFDDDYTAFESVEVDTLADDCFTESPLGKLVIRQFFVLSLGRKQSEREGCDAGGYE